MADVLASEIQMLPVDMSNVSKPPTELGSWIAFAKIYDIKGNSLLCSLLDTASVPYERTYDFKLDPSRPRLVWYLVAMTFKSHSFTRHGSKHQMTRFYGTFQSWILMTDGTSLISSLVDFPDGHKLDGGYGPNSAG